MGGQRTGDTGALGGGVDGGPSDRGRDCVGEEVPHVTYGRGNR